MLCSANVIFFGGVLMWVGGLLEFVLGYIVLYESLNDNLSDVSLFAAIHSLSWSSLPLVSQQTSEVTLRWALR